MRISDWSSDVCSSDLDLIFFSVVGDGVCNPTVAHQIAVPDAISLVDARLVLAKEFGRPFPILPPPGRWDFFEDRLRRRSIEVRQSCPKQLAMFIVGSASLPTMDSRSTVRSEAHTYVLQSLMRITQAVSCLKKQHTN